MSDDLFCRRPVFFGRTCVRCAQDLDQEDLVDTRLGPMHEACYENLGDGDQFTSFSEIDHGDSVWPN